MKLENIKRIEKIDNRYHIIFNDDNVIVLHNRRTILPLLFLIKYGESSNQDLSSNRYNEIVKALNNKCDDNILKNDYKDIIKPYSDLINEEGFSFIKRDKRGKRSYYILSKKDHPLLLSKDPNASFNMSKDSFDALYSSNNGLCYMCDNHISKNEAFLDYIIPLFRGGNDNIDNIQILCKTCMDNKKKVCKNCIELCNSNTCPLKVYRPHKLPIHYAASKLKD